jgi:HEPN domain-containing protein
VTSDRIARDYLHRAGVRRQALDALMAGASYPDVVREAQDLIELVLKGTLRFIGVDPPRRHDVHGAVLHFLDRLPPEWREGLAQMEDALTRLAAQRSPAFYGDEEADVPASALFGQAAAGEALAVADRLLAMYARLLGEAR